MALAMASHHSTWSTSSPCLDRKVKSLIVKSKNTRKPYYRTLKMFALALSTVFELDNASLQLPKSRHVRVCPDIGSWVTDLSGHYTEPSDKCTSRQVVGCHRSRRDLQHSCCVIYRIICHECFVTNLWHLCSWLYHLLSGSNINVNSQSSPGRRHHKFTVPRSC